MPMRPARLGETFTLRGEVVRRPNRWPTERRRSATSTERSSAVPRGPFSCIDQSPNPPPDLYRVPPPGPGVCLICCGPAEASAVCFACRLVGRRLALPLVSVSPARLCPLPGPLYTVLMGYKESPVPEARARFSPMVCQLFDVFFATHSACVDGDDPVDQVLAVPSSARPSGPPLAGVRVGRCRAVQARYAFSGRPALPRPGDARAHAAPSATGLSSRRPGAPAVQGRHLLLLDDTYVSGARAQSAAAALRLAGAGSVQIVVAGRVLRPDRVPAHADFLRRQVTALSARSEGAVCRCCAETNAPSG